jgi:hypothetical protein
MTSFYVKQGFNSTLAADTSVIQLQIFKYLNVLDPACAIIGREEHIVLTLC